MDSAVALERDRTVAVQLQLVRPILAFRQRARHHAVLMQVSRLKRQERRNEHESGAMGRSHEKGPDTQAQEASLHADANAMAMPVQRMPNRPKNERKT